MKFYCATTRRGAFAVRRYATTAGVITAGTITIGAFALMFAAAMAGTSQAQDAAKDGSTWERVDSVLVLPPVYQANAESAPSDACAEDCASSNVPGNRELPTAVAGTADNPSAANAGTADNLDESAAANDAAPDGTGSDGAGSKDQQAAAGDDQQQNADIRDDSLGSTQDYEEQRAAAQELGPYGIVQVPRVIIGVPVGSYYAPSYARRTFAPAAPVVAPMRRLPTSPAWMPQPMARMAPLPPIVPRVVPRTVGGFSGGFSGGFRGGSPNMSGFHGGFGHR